MNKGIIYKAIIKGKNDVTYYIKLEKTTRKNNKIVNSYNKGKKHIFKFDTQFTSNLNLTYYVGKVLDFELNFDPNEIISVADIMINNSLQNGGKK